MTHRIWCALKRALDCLLSLLVPASGRHRKPVPATGPECGTALPRSVSGRRLLVRPIKPPRLPLTGTRQRPRRVVADEGPLIDGASPLVRPYLLAHEQQERRAALALALEGIDVGPWIIHGHPVGAPAVGVAA